MHTLGINAAFHDSAASLVKDGGIYSGRGKKDLPT